MPGKLFSFVAYVFAVDAQVNQRTNTLCVQLGATLIDALRVASGPGDLVACDSRWLCAPKVK